jgi:hypothetical protein
VNDQNVARRLVAWAFGLVFAAICVAVNFLVAPVDKRVDLTSDRRYTLPEPVVRIAKKLGANEPCKADVYLSEDLPLRFAHIGRALRTRFSELRRASNGGLEYEFIDPKDDDDLAQRLEQQHGIKPVPVQDLKSGSLVVANYYLSVVLRRAKEKEVVNLAELGGQILQDEEATLAALADFLAARLVKLTSPEVVVGLMSEKKESPQRKERTDGIEESVRKRLLTHAKVQDVFVKNGTPVPSDVRTLIVHRPEDLTDLELFQLDQFVMRGGRLIVLYDNYSTYDPDRDAAVAQAMLQRGTYALRPVKSGMVEFLSHYGMSFSPGVVHDRSNFRGMMTVLAPNGLPMQQTMTLAGVVNVRSVDDDKAPTGQVDEEEPTVSGLAPLSFVLPAPMETDPEGTFAERHPGARLETFLKTSNEAWVVAEPGESLVMNNAQPPAREEWRSFALAARAEGTLKSFFATRDIPVREGTPPEHRPNPESKLVQCASDAPGQVWVFADADFALDAWRAVAQRLMSMPLMQGLAKSQSALMNATDMASFGDELVGVRRTRLLDRSVDAARVAEDRTWILIKNIFLVPAILAVLGLLRWAWRASATFVPSPPRPPISNGTSRGAGGAEASTDGGAAASHAPEDGHAGRVSEGASSEKTGDGS